MLVSSSIIRIVGLLLQILRGLFNLYSLLIVVNALLSWIPSLNYSKVGQWIAKIVDPYLNWFRRGPFVRLIQATGIDFSPIVALMVLYFLEDVVINQWLVAFLVRVLG